MLVWLKLQGRGGGSLVCGMSGLHRFANVHVSEQAPLLAAAFHSWATQLVDAIILGLSSLLCGRTICAADLVAYNAVGAAYLGTACRHAFQAVLHCMAKV